MPAPETAYLIPLFPFLAFVVILFLSPQLRKASGVVACGAMALSFLYAWPCFQLTRIGYERDFTFPWAQIAGRPLPMGYQIDGLTGLMLMVVTFIGFWIFVYSTGYMSHDPRYSRFFAYMSLFACAMLTLVMADNYLLLYFGWEGVGLCSYLLIGFWFEKPEAARAAKKAFLVTRTGDCGLALGIFLLFSLIGNLSFAEIFAKVTDANGGPLLATGTLTLAALLILFGAIGKSAQFPLHVWLPDAMEGPTPVSALIHAATMVAAGVYLVARSYPLFMANGANSTALTVVAWIGGITAFMAATIAVAQNDIKRVLAYSTISQLGYMMMGLGVGGYTAGMFHLMTHAFFKALLFLGSGSVIHGCGGEQDMRQMGGLRKAMPHTFWTYFVGYLALAGIPPLAGFWSKDEILHHAMKHNTGVFVLGLLGAFLTAFYMTRQMCLVFGGHPRNHDIHAHESPLNMTLPLYVLAAFAAVIGLVGYLGDSFHHLVHLPDSEAEPMAWGGAAVSAAIAGVGIAIGYRLYGRGQIASPETEPLRPVLGKVYGFLENKWWFDELYQATVLRFLFACVNVCREFDQRVVDGLVNLTGFVGVGSSILSRLADNYIVDGLVNFVGWITKLCGSGLRRVQTGLAQNYMLMIFAGTVMLVIWRMYH